MSYLHLFSAIKLANSFKSMLIVEIRTQRRFTNYNKTMPSFSSFFSLKKTSDKIHHLMIFKG